MFPYTYKFGKFPKTIFSTHFKHHAEVTGTSLMYYRTCQPCPPPPSCDPCTANKKRPAGPCGTSGGAGRGGKFKITWKPYRVPLYPGHDEKNMRMRRPMSPALDAFGPTAPAMTSVLQRATGLGFTAFTLVFAASELFVNGGTSTTIKLMESLHLPQVVGIGIKAALAFMILFHYINGFRFIMFNFAMWLDLKATYRTLYIALLLSAVGAGAWAVRGFLW